MYIILGYDEIAHALARNLSRSGEETLVVGNDEAVFAGLKEPNLRTVVADIHTVDFGSLPMKNAIALILLHYFVKKLSGAFFLKAFGFNFKIAMGKIFVL
ncbi:MAG: NAD-binding protein [Candidatus Brocadiaceae bacterium]|nr:NAD-binding protein [Candidatus Brocadiaceae bacterium]